LENLQEDLKLGNGRWLYQWVLASFRDLMPIPARNIQANPTLKQNPGY
jgi:hypothetical protein